eukprot:TRINITY_DN7525_c0_g1_i1.p1 TRINITY_DN7525_c0_g1~~TRINITY_DN7525_c0_g1_i1.p1  ORF type:complete len:113 (-),score=13.58 TRINITY_DN7525_c0_g1_i1:24-338(-)
MEPNPDAEIQEENLDNKLKQERGRKSTLINGPMYYQPNMDDLCILRLIPCNRCREKDKLLLNSFCYKTIHGRKRIPRSTTSISADGVCTDCNEPYEYDNYRCDD